MIRTKSRNLTVFRHTFVFAQYIEAKCWVDNEDVVGAVPAGDGPTTSEYSTMLLLTKVRLILEISWYFIIIALATYHVARATYTAFTDIFHVRIRSDQTYMIS